jgi:hypothetical protein
MESSDNASPRRRFQFSLRGLMVLMFGVAVGFSAAMGAKETDFDERLYSFGERLCAGLLAAVSAWVALGLINQARDLWSAFHGRSGLCSEERWGWRFAVLWRVGVACLLVGYYTINILLARELLALPERNDDFWHVGARLRDALFHISLLIALAGVPRVRQSRPRPSRFQPVINILGWLAAAYWCLFVWSNMMIVPALVHISIMGTAMAEPLWLSRESMITYSTARLHHFLWASICAVGLLLAHLGVVRQFARQQARRLRRRWLWAGVLIPSLAIVAVYPIWLVARRLRDIAPLFAETYDPGPSHLWVAAGLLIAVFVTCASRRLMRAARNPARASELHWRRDPQRYYHEGRTIAVLVVIALALKFIMDFIPTLQDLWDMTRFFASYDNAIGWCFEELFCDPSTYLLVTVLLIAVRNVFRGRVRSIDSRLDGPPGLPVVRFCVVWCILFLTVVFAVPTLAGLGFAIGLSPSTWPWPLP